MEKLHLSANLVNAILQYLGTQPYTSVVRLINDIQQEAQAQAPAAQPKKVEAEPVN